MAVELEAPDIRRGGAHPAAAPPRASGALRIGLINNMGDAALAPTEAQFAGLLSQAAGPERVLLRISSFAELPRNAEAQAYVRARYWPLERLLEEPLDGLIVTGTEPRTPRLEEEPYWPRFGQLLEWAPRHTHASIWSCLAAHAAVRILDGIERQRLPEKRCGVYAQQTLAAHALLQGIERALPMPHSRWNDLPLDALRSAGYVLLSASAECGVGAFVKEGPSPMLLLQGHPEYEPTTLLKEYRRDVGRYLSAQQSDYPTLPYGYLTPAAIACLEQFREQALARRSPQLLERFPFAAVAQELAGGWHTHAVQLYRNWLAGIQAARRAAGWAEPVALSAS